MKTTRLTMLAAWATALFLAGAAEAQTTNASYTYNVNSAVPDGNPSGLSSTTNISGMSETISSVQVSLDITGGFNGDLYAYLDGPAGGFVVLLNRPGLTGSNPFGYGDAGCNITLSDGSPDIHTYQLDSPAIVGGQLTQTWAPDGRNIDPMSDGSMFDSTSPSTPLSVFNGTTANGSSEPCSWLTFPAAAPRRS